MDLVTVPNMLAGVAVFVVAYPIVYGIGWAFSRGYHRGKREFVEDLIRDNPMKENDRAQ